MSKKMMLLALAVTSAALVAIPAFASAEEIHFDTATTFTGTGGAFSWVAAEEPTSSCQSGDISNGVINAGGTTGTMTLEFTGCSISAMGTMPCHTAGSPLDNTISFGSTMFHLITSKNASGAAVPAILVTANTIEFICNWFGFPVTTHLAGSIIGTITIPKCSESSNKLGLSFSATGSTQNHLEYTGTKYDLVSRTGAGESRTIGLNFAPTLTTNTAGTLTCT